MRQNKNQWQIYLEVNWEEYWVEELNNDDWWEKGFIWEEVSL